jgi:hypothetical protein
MVELEQGLASPPGGRILPPARGDVKARVGEPSGKRYGRTPMRVECGWCGRELEGGEAAEDETSHGVCPACARRWLEDDGPRRDGASSSRRGAVVPSGEPG